jgi:hypothetical protein
MTKPQPTLEEVMTWVLNSILDGCKVALGNNVKLDVKAEEIFQRRYAKSFDYALNVLKKDWWAAETNVLATAKKHGQVAGIIQSFQNDTAIVDEMSLVKAGHLIEIECKTSSFRGQFCW